LSARELIEGGQHCADKGRRYRPRIVAVLGIGAYRRAFERPQAVLGQQREMLNGSMIWLLPNPSGLNAYYQVKDLARMFQELREAAEALHKKAV
jgi:TDG/mug DNA glycosylase family protein